MAEIIDSTPNAQAYDEEVETLRGRFAANIANIRLFKDNPYLDEMTDEDRNAANADLLVPHHGEQFYDDDKFVYVCQYEKDPVTLQTKYVYYSKEKELNEKMNYYESQGVLNQLMSAYNNGKVYCFFMFVCFLFAAGWRGAVPFDSGIHAAAGNAVSGAGILFSDKTAGQNRVDGRRYCSCRLAECRYFSGSRPA